MRNHKLNTFGTGFFVGGCVFALLNVIIISLAPSKCEPDAERNFYLGHEAGMKEYAEYYGLPIPSHGL